MKQQKVWKRLLLFVLIAAMAMPAAAGNRHSAADRRAQLVAENACLTESVPAHRWEPVPVEGGGEAQTFEKHPVCAPYGGELSLFEGGEPSGEAFAIYVDGRRISSDQAASGTSWEYDPENQWLTLYDYNGAEIVSYGSLCIWSYGDSVIQGNGWYGVFCDGDLKLHCMDGTLTVTGSEADERYSYEAVYATESLICTALEDTVMTLTGGASRYSGVYGGDGVCAPLVALREAGQINITGGAAVSPAEYGGYAIYAIRVLVYADCHLRGGAGLKPSEAICVTEYCTISHVNAVVEASAPGCSLFQGGTLYVNYAEHQLSEDQSSLIVTPKTYTLTVECAGGMLDGLGTVTVEVPFEYSQVPSTLDLSKVVPVRYGYVQTGWLSALGTEEPQPVALNSEYILPFTPEGAETQAQLTAVWQYVGPEYVVEEDGVAVAVPDGWCVQQQVSSVVLAVYDGQGKLLAADAKAWSEGVDLWLEVTPDMAQAACCKVFLLNSSGMPVQEPLPKALIETPPETPPAVS